MRYSGIKETVYKIIKERILTSEIQPGERIMEERLAEELSVSRTPVREAIQKLIAEGFVVDVSRKGVFCREWDQEQLRSMLEVREVLEVLSAEKCVKKASEEQIAMLEKLLRSYDISFAAEDWAECNAYDSRFHRTLAQITGNEMLIRFISIIEDYMAIQRNVEEKIQHRTKFEKAQVSHCALIEAIKNGDVSAAKKAARDNISEMRRNLQLS